MADKKDFEVDGKALSSLRVVDLKQELEKRCLSKSGSKKDLVDRLKTQLKLERLHESASTDEGHVPNLKLQDEIAEPSDVIKEYLAKQQKIYAIQKEARRRVELEEQQVRDGSEASAGDTSQEEEEPQEAGGASLGETSKVDVVESTPIKELAVVAIDQLLDSVQAEKETGHASFPETRDDITAVEQLTKEFNVQSKETEAEIISVDDSFARKASNQLVESVIHSDVEVALPVAVVEGVDVEIEDVKVDSRELKVDISDDANEQQNCAETGDSSRKIGVVIPPVETPAQSEEIEASHSSHSKIKWEEKMSPSPSSLVEDFVAPPVNPSLDDQREDSLNGGSDAVKKEDLMMKDKERSRSPHKRRCDDGDKDKCVTNTSADVSKKNGNDDDAGRSSTSSGDDEGIRVKRSGVGRQHRRRSHHRSVSTTSSSSSSSSENEAGGVQCSRSSSSASAASCSPKRTDRVAIESPKWTETKEMDNVSCSSLSRKVLLAKEDVDTVAIMEIDEDLDTFALTGGSQTDVAKEVGMQFKLTSVLDAKKPDQKKSVVTATVTDAGPPRIASRKLSLSASKECGDRPGEKPQKRRKWGGGGNGASSSLIVAGKRNSVSISTDSLKGLIPDMKESLPILLDGDPHSTSTVDKNPVADKPSVTEINLGSSSTKREKIVFNSPAVQPLKEEGTLEQSVKDDTKGKVVLLRKAPVRSAPVIAAATPGRLSSSSPARNLPTTIVHVRNLVRPFTLGQLKELLGQTGQLVDSGFWIDKIKSKCYVSYMTEEQAVATRSALHGTQWPSSNPKRLVVDYANQDELEFHRKLVDPLAAPKPGSQAAVAAVTVSGNENLGMPVRGPAATVAADVTAKPVDNKDRRRSVKENRDAESSRKNKRERRDFEGGGGDGRLPVREWDRDKIGERSPGERVRPGRQRGRLVSMSRSRSPLSRLPFKERDRHMKGEAAIGDRRGRRVERRRDVVDEEAPAKLLDDLFRKTKATPCIYWLPLTSDQIRAKEDQRKQRQVEREKRRRNQQTTAMSDAMAPAIALSAESNNSKRNNRENRDDSRNRRLSAGSRHSRFRRR